MNQDIFRAVAEGNDFIIGSSPQAKGLELSLKKKSHFNPPWMELNSG